MYPLQTAPNPLVLSSLLVIISRLYLSMCMNQLAFLLFSPDQSFLPFYDTGNGVFCLCIHRNLILFFHHLHDWLTTTLPVVYYYTMGNGYCYCGNPNMLFQGLVLHQQEQEMF